MGWLRDLHSRGCLQHTQASSHTHTGSCCAPKGLARLNGAVISLVNTGAQVWSGGHNSNSGGWARDRKAGMMGDSEAYVNTD